MKHVLVILLLFLASEAHAAKKKNKVTKKPRGIELTVGAECTLKKPLAATMVVGKKKKKTKLAKTTQLTVLKVGPMVTVATSLGEVFVKKALLAKTCELKTSANTEDALAAQTPEHAPDEEPPVEPAWPQSASQPASAPFVAEPVVESPTVAVAPPQAAPPPPAAEVMQAPAPERKPRVMRGFAITFTVIGALGIAGGGTMMTLALINNGQLNRRINAYNADATRPRAVFETFAPAAAQVQLFTTIAIISGAVGVAALTTGIILFAVDKTPNDVASFKLAPSFFVSPMSTHLGLVGQF